MSQSNSQLEQKLASNLRVSNGRAEAALQKSGYDYHKAVEYILSDREASDLILTAIERTNSETQSSNRRNNNSSSSSSQPTFGRKSLSSMLNFSSLSLSREKSKDVPAAADDERSRRKSTSSEQGKDRPRALSLSRTRSKEEKDGSSRTGRVRTRSSSPWRRRRSMASRDPSPAVEALRQSQSDAELSDNDDATSVGSKRSRRSWGIGPRRTAFWKRYGSDSESSSSSSEDDSDDETVAPGRPSDGDLDGETYESPDFSSGSAFASSRSIDLLTEENTEKNTLLSYGPNGELLYGPDDTDNDADPLGEGINVVRPEEPLFPTSPTSLGSRGRPDRVDGGDPAVGQSTAAQSVAGPEGSPSGSPAARRKKKSIFKSSDRLEFKLSRPSFARDRCTVTVTHGNPEAYLRELPASGQKPREPKTYVVASDLSMESGYAVEWGIGTVLRDGDKMILVSVQETDTKLDPEPGAVASDRVAKIRNQQERQGLVNLLVREVTGLLQRTKLQCTVICLAVHAKNSRRLLLDLIDYVEPAMLIVGSRGRGQLKGILLGSTSHYLIQKSSVPVMVARRRLKHPVKRTAHLTVQRPTPGSTYLQGGRSKLTEAVIDKTGPGKVDHDVETMRVQLQKEESEEVATRARSGSLGEGMSAARYTTTEDDE